MIGAWIAALLLAAAPSGGGVKQGTVRAIQSGPPISPVTKRGVKRRHGNYDASFMDGVGHYPMLERPVESNRRREAALAEVLAAGASKPRTTTR